MTSAEKIIKVFGHMSPDTDATASAIVWSWFLNNYRNQSAVPYILSNPNTEALFVLDRWNQDLPKVLESITKGDQVAIVDTNNADELFENINDAEIISIIDHHKLTGGLKTNLPREIIIQTYASTMTVMFNVMNIEPKDLPRNIGGLMLSGILSDTLEFRSPTTTDADRALALDLSLAHNVDIPKYASEMFEAKSDISHFSDAELLRLDSKIYPIDGENHRISVLETTNPEIVLARAHSIADAIPQVCKEDACVNALLFVIDILREEATLLVTNEAVRSIAEKAFETEILGDTLVLPGVMSRKKQILPALTK